MAPLIFILVAVALLGGFFVLTDFEKRRGQRLFAAKRDRFDKDVAHVEFILQRVDLAAFLRSEIRLFVSRIGHDIAHLSLMAVRAAERLLTRLVRHLRSQHVVDTTSRESARPFVKTLSDFKDRLKASRPEVPDIQ